MYDTFDVLFSIIFIIALVGIIFSISSTINSYVKNSNSPIICVQSKVISKRIDIQNHIHSSSDNTMMNSSSTEYFVTFETEHGERLELDLSGRMYGLLVEGDVGELIYQGEWFKDFKRIDTNNFHNNMNYKEY